MGKQLSYSGCYRFLELYYFLENNGLDRALLDHRIFLPAYQVHR